MSLDQTHKYLFTAQFNGRVESSPKMQHPRTISNHDVDNITTPHRTFPQDEDEEAILKKVHAESKRESDNKLQKVSVFFLFFFNVPIG